MFSGCRIVPYVIRSISSLIKICKRCKPKVGNDILLHLHAYEVIQRYNVFVLLLEFAYTMFSNCYSRLGQHLFSGPSPARIKSQIYSILRKRVLVSHKDLMSSWSQSCKIMARYLQNYIRSCHNFAHVMTAPWYIKKYQIKIIKRLNVKHSSDYDNVWTTSLKEISPLIISLLTLILNQSFSNVIFFSDKLKVTKIIPLLIKMIYIISIITDQSHFLLPSPMYLKRWFSYNYMII